MGLDIRLPLGLLFVIIGLLLSGFGAFSDHAIYARSLGINVNLWWGLVMLVTGITLLKLSTRRAPVATPDAESLGAAPVSALAKGDSTKGTALDGR